MIFVISVFMNSLNSCRIVNTPEDAFKCFMGTELDNLAIGNCYLNKSEQNQNLKEDYKQKFELDWLIIVIKNWLKFLFNYCFNRT